MQLLSLLILVTFVVLRNSFTIFNGKRDRTKVTSFIYWGRKLIEIAISFVVPALLLLGVIPIKTFSVLYILGVLLSLKGLVFMLWTRLCRNTDWGFMGDDSGETLFTGGPYRYTRHPYYAGAILVGIGLYLQLNYWLALLMIPVVFFIAYVIKKEDVFLEQRFGQTFIDYKKKTGVFPWFY